MAGSLTSTQDSFWPGRQVFITGITGLLGGWLAERLLARGARVVGLIRDHVPDSRLLRERAIAERIVAVHGELEDAALLERVINEHEIDTVFHLGAQTIVQTANRNPVSTFRANIEGTWNMLEACRRTPQLVQRIIVASSDKAYGTAESLPYDETAPLIGRHPYDVSKSCADLIAQSYVHTYRLPVVVTRCGNLFGPGDLNFNRIVPGTIRSLLLGERPIIRSDGSFVRDYLYVEDAADAYIALAEALTVEPGVRGEAFNVSYEHPMTVIELTALIQRLLGREDLEPDIRNVATAEIHAQYLSAAKFRSMIRWQPSYHLEEGLRRTIDWYRALLAS